MATIQQIRDFIKTKSTQIKEKAESEGSVIPCSMGCSHCCKNYKIKCHPDEVLSFYNMGLAIDEDRLQAQVDDWESADTTCIMLDQDGMCMVHDIKPMACEMYYVTTPVDNCMSDSGVNPLCVSACKTKYYEVMSDSHVYLHEEYHRLMNL